MAKRAGGSRASRPKPDRTARPGRAPHAGEFARDEVLAGEAADEIAKNATIGRSTAVNHVIESHVASPNQELQQAERDRHAEEVVVSAALVIGMLRHFIVKCDEDQKPFVRVIGRIMHILTVDGKKESCTATPIAIALLLFLPDHLDEEHRQGGTNRDTIDVTEPRLQALLYDRLKKLTTPKWHKMAWKEPSGRGYRLNENGRFVFHDWPEDVAFDPHNADLWKRKHPRLRVGGGGRGPATRR